MKMFEKFTDKLLTMNVINNEEKELYIYGFQQGFLLFINFITVIVVGLIFHKLWESVVFISAYSLLRAYAGGYHTNTQLRCYLFSVATMILVLSLINFIPWNSTICIMIAAVASIIILILAPVEDKNKPLSNLEVAIFKKKANINLIILIALIAVFWHLGLMQVVISISVALGIMSIMLILGKIKNSYQY